MALISCPECENEVSDKARTCPHCGFPLVRRTSSTRPHRDPAGDLDKVLKELVTVGEDLEQVAADDFDTRQRLRERQASLRVRAERLRKARPTDHRGGQTLTQTAPSKGPSQQIRMPASPPVPAILVISQVLLVLVALAGLALLAWGASNDWDLGAPIVAVLGMAAFFGVALFFLPAHAAATRNAPNRGAVLAVNILLGWTGIGWIVALAMAYSQPATHKWKRVRGGGWQLVPRRGAPQSQSRIEGGEVSKPTARRPEDRLRPGQEAVIVADPGAMAWADKNRIERVGVLRQWTPVKVAAMALGSDGWMAQVLTNKGDRCWVSPRDLGPR